LQSKPLPPISSQRANRALQATRMKARAPQHER